jgi:hypothetical protein
MEAVAPRTLPLLILHLSDSTASTRLRTPRLSTNLLGRVGAPSKRPGACVQGGGHRPCDREIACPVCLLRRGSPWLAGIDLDTGAPRRRVAHLSEILRGAAAHQSTCGPAPSATDVVGHAREDYRPAHEALEAMEFAGRMALRGRSSCSRVSNVQPRSREQPGSCPAHARDGSTAAGERLSARPDLAANV